MSLSGYTAAYYERDMAENWYARMGLLRPDQLAAVGYSFGFPVLGDETYPRRRAPGTFFSIGCGRGDLEAHLESQGHKVLGVDPSEGARELYRGSTLVDRYEGGGDTILFVESLEHLEREEIDRIFGLIPARARIVIVNWQNYFPILGNPESGDHITTVDDDLFDDLSAGCRTLVRRGSHLVLEKP